MKKVLNIFSRAGEERTNPSAVPSFREPSLYSNRPSPRPAPAARQAALRKEQPAPKRETMDVPLDYPGIIAFFQNTVSSRKSPFNSLVQAADRLQEYIPDEVGRLKAAYALCGEKWSPEVLALAIHNHIADIDTACAKAKTNKSQHAGERSQQLRAESAELKQHAAGLQTEIERLKTSLSELEARFQADQSKIAELDRQAQFIDGDAGSVAFLDQAAENLKNDLLAKKVLLGLS